MGLKDDIYKAFEKNLGKKYLDADAKGKEKVEALANDLSIAIRDFLLAQTFKVDKLSMNYTSKNSSYFFVLRNFLLSFCYNNF